MAVTSILNNVAALGASYQLGITGLGLQDTIQRLTTGKRINQASDDASGLVIANSLTSSTQINTQGQDNANNLLTSLQTMDGTLNEATNLLTRAAELAQEAQGTGAATAPLNSEFQSIMTTFSSLVGSAFTGIGLTGSATAGGTAGTLSTALGSYGASALTVTISGISTTSLLADNLTTGASAAASDIAAALTAIGNTRGGIGAGEESLQSYSNVLGIQMQNETAQLSQIQDANVANEVVNLTKFQILNQSGISALSKANQAGESILTLLQ